MFLIISTLALSPSSPWSIRAFNTSETSLVVDWSNIPGGLQAKFFVLSVNQTRPANYHDVNKGSAGSMFRTVNSSLTSLSLPNLPVFSEHVIRVYLVGDNGEVYKSKQVTAETDEGGNFFLIWRPFLFSGLSVVVTNYVLYQNKGDFFLVKKIAYQRFLDRSSTARVLRPWK